MYELAPDEQPLWFEEVKKEIRRQRQQKEECEQQRLILEEQVV
ncbi:MAG: hypothetical protein Q7S65_06020 [Nanoarchaeota archaeon]|nr:hypothetical protein [Nanoarchaeota archaeon]